MNKFDTAIINGKIFKDDTETFSDGNIFIKKNTIVFSDDVIWKADRTIDARQCYVVPGLIDEHAHVHYQGSNLGMNADILCPPNGITTVVDAGTTGCDNFSLFYSANICRYVTNTLAYLNVAPFGCEDGYRQSESLNPDDFNKEKIDALFSLYPSILRGLKIRLDKATLTDIYSLDSFVKCIEISTDLHKKGFHCVVEAHIANLPPRIKLEDVVSMMRKGDILVHAMQNRGETIFNQDGTIKAAVLDAKRRGVIIDGCNGRIHWSFKNLENAKAQNFVPDVISSDTVFDSAFVKPGFSLLYAMNTYLTAGFSPEQIITAVTKKPSQVLGVSDKIGSLSRGYAADICILKLENTVPLALFDRWGEERTAQRYFKPMVTIRNGKIIYRQIDF